MVKSGVIENLDISPGGGKIFVVGPFHETLNETVDYYLNVSLILKKDEPWAKAGHEMAWEQFSFPTSKSFKDVSEQNNVNTNIHGNIIDVKIQSVAVQFNTDKGSLTSLKWRDVELIERGMRINLWRAPTDNDDGGDRRSYGAQWRKDGLDQLAFQVKTADVYENPSNVKIVVNGALVSPSSEIDVRTIYVVDGSGEIQVINDVTIPERLKTVPRVGTEWLLRKDFNNVKWYGRGPHENYVDRKIGARFGVYEFPVKELYFPYVKPQENGNRCDVYWMSITNEQHIGLLVTGEPTFEFSATNYSLETLTQAKHTVDIVDAPYTTLNIDYRQAGLGGDDSWNPRTHPEYQLRSGNYRFSYKIRPVDLSNNTIKELVD